MSEYIFKLPDLGEGTVESEIGEWSIAVGDTISEDDVVGTMMTDKAAVELASPVSGKVVSLAGEPGDMIAVGAPLIVFKIDKDGLSEEAPKPTADNSSENKSPSGIQAKPAAHSTTISGSSKGKVVTSPAIRRRAREAGIDLTTVSGSGPGGRILPIDFDKHLSSSQAAAPSNDATHLSGVTEIKVIGLRRIIAERMTEANREVPHFSYVEEVDITELEKLRQRLNRKSNDKLSPLPFISLALIRALTSFPQCNSTYDKERNTLVHHRAVHLGVATQTADGLKVPVVRDADRLSLDNLAGEIRRVSQAAKDGAVDKKDLSGSTITVTSLGKLGGIASTPIINMPEVSIIGVNRAVERPMVVDGQIVIRTMMNLSSSFDHRFVDGYDAAAMIRQIKEMLEHPATIFFEDA